ncbi:hypothetical protein CWE09_08235 [Aliidiomarina minuta]|uniref:MSHA biogenesis protein MshO n=1 Tax=Aliidiomarina minuta TaxID=880057 RepID=A0A432W9F5_9GAMM|nr:type II secretion system protein [Aliidiomarina minuta]RUO26675.1 hypothetical protein CWE09_08235 [Aliidiomarina minuta]
MLYQLRNAGFTLVELIIVIVLLSIMSIATFSYLGFGAQIFSDVVGRDQLISQSRFAVERLTRELRNSLPGSARVINNNRCLELLPIHASSSYLELPQPGQTNADFVAVPPDNYSQGVNYEGTYLFVYANSEQRIYNSTTQRKVISGVTEQDSTLIFDYNTTPTLFPLQSPAQRYFISTGPVSWCLEATGEIAGQQQLVRITGYPLANSPDLAHGDAQRAVMASDLYNNIEGGQLPFFTIAATLQRANLVEIDLRFARRQGAEPFIIHHEVHIPNVP